MRPTVVHSQSLPVLRPCAQSQPAFESPPTQAHPIVAVTNSPSASPVPIFPKKSPYRVYARSASFPGGFGFGSFDSKQNSSQCVPLTDFCTNIRRKNTMEPSSAPICMHCIGTISYNNGNTQPSPKQIIGILLLPQLDDTQTALAIENIHLSETQTIQWRMIARDQRSNIVVVEQNSRQSCMQPIISTVTRALRGRQPVSPSSPEAARP